MKKKAWDMLSVRRWEDVSREVEKNKKVHVGKVFEICDEKGSEVPANNPLRKFKGRTVLQGNSVKDESREVALSSERGASPATMEASKREIWQRWQKPYTKRRNPFPTPDCQASVVASTSIRG